MTPRPGYICGVTPSDELIDLGDRRLRVRRLAPRQDDGLERTTLVFLHEGLGCIEMWRDFPQSFATPRGAAASSTTAPAMAARARGRPIPASATWRSRPTRCCRACWPSSAIEDCVLVGHSDGGTIALNYAATRSRAAARRGDAGRARHQRAGLRRRHRRAREAFAAGDLRQRLQKYHGDNTDGAFHLWSDAWVAPGFEPMDADGRLPGVVVPVQAIQGEDDEYGSELQLGIIAGKVGGYCETRLVPDCGHSPHLQQPAYVLSEITRFVAPLALVG